MISALIPIYGHDPHRMSAARWIIQWWRKHHPDVEIVRAAGESKGASFADAASRASGSVFVLADADVWCTLDAAFAAIEDGAPWAVPHQNVHRLDPTTTTAILAGDVPDHLGYAQKPYRGRVGGGMTVLRREVYDRVPVDPRFVGWGQEDDAWGLALRTLVGAPWRGTTDLWHLWHPEPERLSRKVGNNGGRALFARYKAAARHPKRMTQLVEEYR